MSFFTKSKKKGVALLFDIGSSSVGGALFETNSSGTPEILFSTRESVPLRPEIDAGVFLSLALPVLSTVVSRLCLLGMKKPEKIFCALSSPWHVSEVRKIKLERDSPFVFTPELADELIDREVQILKREIAVRFAGPGGGTRLLEFKNMRTVLNGYSVLDPFGKKARKAEMVVFASAGGESILEKIKETVGRHFYADQARFFSFTLSAFSAIRDFFPEQEDFLLVDVSGEVTEISAVKGGILQSSASFPLGSNFVARSLSGYLGISLPEAESLSILFQEGHASSAVEDKLLPAIEDASRRWTREFQVSLSDVSTGISLPKTVYLSVSDKTSNFFLSAVKTEQFSQYALTESKFKVMLLDSKTLHGMVSFAAGVARDPVLSLEAFYVNRFLC